MRVTVGAIVGMVASGHTTEAVVREIPVWKKRMSPNLRSAFASALEAAGLPAVWPVWEGA